MTLNLTIVAPWGVWQCSDHRVTWLRRGKTVRTDDYSMKQLALECSDGSALITYTGLGALDHAKGELHVSDWMRRLVRGPNRTVDQNLIRIREQATADLAGPAARAGIPHTFVVGAFLRRRPWAAVISNMQLPPGSPPLRRFETAAMPVDDPMCMVTGEGDAPSRKTTGRSCNGWPNGDQAARRTIPSSWPRSTGERNTLSTRHGTRSAKAA